MSSAITRVSKPSTGSAYTYDWLQHANPQYPYPSMDNCQSHQCRGHELDIVALWLHSILHTLSKCMGRTRTSVTTRVVRDSVSGLPIMSPITSTGLPPAFMPRSTPLHECISYTAIQKMRKASEQTLIDRHRKVNLGSQQIDHIRPSGGLTIFIAAEGEIRTFLKYLGLPKYTRAPRITHRRGQRRQK